MKMRFGELLISRGVITNDQLESALALQKDNPERKIGEILVTLGAIDVASQPRNGYFCFRSSGQS